LWGSGPFDWSMWQQEGAGLRMHAGIWRRRERGGSNPTQLQRENATHRAVIRNARPAAPPQAAAAADGVATMAWGLAGLAIELSHPLRYEGGSTAARVGPDRGAFIREHPRRS
jgi:hypothetical protein